MNIQPKYIIMTLKHIFEFKMCKIVVLGIGVLKLTVNICGRKSVKLSFNAIKNIRKKRRN